MTQPSSIEAAHALVGAGQVTEAVRLLELAAGRGDAHAAMALGAWRLAGNPIRRDLGLARDWFGRAVAAGLVQAEPAYIAMLASGAGGSGRRWQEALALLDQRSATDALAQREVALLTSMEIDAMGNPLRQPEFEEISADPLVRTLPGLLSADECRFLCDISEPILQVATVGDPRTGRKVLDPVRKAKVATYPFIAESPLIHAINRRIAAATGTTYEQGEPLQIIHYSRGDEFRFHSDAVTHDKNQRLATLLVTLDDGFAGGATSFPRLGYDYRGAVGDALHFINVDTDGRPDPRTWHAGLPVIEGRKVMLSKWIRTEPLDLTGRPGMPL